MLTKALFGKFRTLSEEVQGMVFDFKFEEFANHALDLMDTRVTKFKYVATVVTYQVVMLFVGEAAFIEGQVLSELVLHHKICVEKQFNGVVNSCPAYFVFFLFKNFEEMLYVKMLIE